MVFVHVQAPIAEKLLVLKAIEDGLLLLVLGALVLLLNVGSRLPFERLPYFFPD